MILSQNVRGRHIQGHSKSYPLIFDNMGFMILGKPKIFTKMEIIVKVKACLHGRVRRCSLFAAFFFSELTFIFIPLRLVILG